MTGNIPPKGKGRLFTIGQVFPDMTGYQKQTYYNAIHSGTGELSKLPFYRIGRSIRIAEEDLNTFLERRRVDPRAGTAG
jgi:excisionase family DNA binding protein